ncbi:MAG: trigger factor [Chloroflexi bacterium]|nr:trigger factor [Chloroflexota bacterium]
MKTTKEYTDDHQVKITAEFEQDLLEQFKRRAARKIAKNTRIPGFRPGKAPYNMVLNHVGEASVIQEAIDLLLEEEYPKVLDQEGIKPWGPGNLENISSYEPPIFEFVIPLEAEVALIGDDKLNKEYAPEAVTDEEIEQELERFKRNFADVVPVERAAKEGDVVYFTLEGTDKNAVDEDAVIIKETPQQVLIEAEDVKRPSEWPFEGFNRKFIGKKAGKSLEFEHSFPEDARDESLAGKTVKFVANLQEVKELQSPELNEEILQQIGDYETEEALREDIKKAIENRKNTEYDDQYFTELVDELRENSTIKYCPQQLEDAEEDMLHQVEHHLSHQGMDLELLLKLRKQDKETYIEEEIKPHAKNRLERSLIMNELTRKHELKIDEKVLEAEIQKIIGQMIQSGELERAQKDLGAKKFSESVTMEAYNRAMGQAQFELLKSLANPDIIQVEAPKPKKVSSKTKISTKKAEAVPEKEEADKTEEETEE